MIVKFGALLWSFTSASPLNPLSAGSGDFFRLKEWSLINFLKELNEIKDKAGE
jgi:hypothetical protein